MDNRPLMTVFAGTNGAGKSTITTVLLEHLYLGEVIDADAIAKELNPGSPERANWAAGREVLHRVEKCISAGRDFSIETTLAGGNALRQMRMAKKNGFEIALYYIGLTNVDLHVTRVSSRAKAGGHYIPEEIIRERYERSFGNLAKAIAIADHVILIDNSETAEVVLQVTDRRISFEAARMPSWAAKVKELIERD